MNLSVVTAPIIALYGHFKMATVITEKLRCEVGQSCSHDFTRRLKYFLLAHLRHTSGLRQWLPRPNHPYWLIFLEKCIVFRYTLHYNVSHPIQQKKEGSTASGSPHATAKQCHKEETMQLSSHWRTVLVPFMVEPGNQVTSLPPRL